MERDSMRTIGGTSVLLISALFAFSAVLPSATPSSDAGSLAEASRAAPFLGRWDVTIHTQGHDYGSWLEITSVAGQLQGRMVTRWGHAHAVLNLRADGGVLTFSSPKSEEAMPEDMAFRGRLVDGKLSGETAGPNGAQWTWTGERAPTLKRAAAPRWGKSIPLFNGVDTEGWRFLQPKVSSNWSVKDHVLTTARRGSDIATTRKFRDFKLHVEFNCAVKCNSGVYLRGRYEVQVADISGSGTPPNRRAGAIYGYLSPSPEVVVTPGVWQTFDITLVGRTVTVASNGKTVIDQQEIPGVTGGALDSNEGEPGPIYLQGSEYAGATSYRNIVITPATE
jgi:hypothetical protein